MANSTVSTTLSAIANLQGIAALLGPQLQELTAEVRSFRQEPPTPTVLASVYESPAVPVLS